VLLRRGWRLSKKTVLKLMRELGLHCPVRRRKRYNSFRDEVGEASANVLNRQFSTELRHTKWATDATEFTVGSSKVYLSPILGLHDNPVLSSTAGPSPSVKMVSDGLRVAIDALGPGEKPLVHSDHATPNGETRWATRDSPSRCPAKADVSTTPSWKGSSATSKRNGSVSRNPEHSTSFTWG